MTAQEFKYTNYMTLEEWKKFKVNYEKYWGIDRTIKDYLIMKNSDSFSGFMSGAFNWSVTPELHTYWWKISNRTEPLNLTKCK